MATKFLFTDDENEMECFLNNKGTVSIYVGRQGDDTGCFCGLITLDKDDVNQLIHLLKQIEQEMEE